MTDECKNCRFWSRLETGVLYHDEMELVVEEDVVFIGHCRRWPPVTNAPMLLELGKARMRDAGTANDGLINYHLSKSAQLPVTWDADWCGEWQEIPLDGRR